MDKQRMREQMRVVLAKLSYEDYKERSKVIGRKLLQEPSIREGKTIALTMSNRPEVDTTMIIEALWQLGKQVCIPKCKPGRAMDFYTIDGFFQTERSKMAILEPIPELTKLVAKDELDVIIVPGIVFDTCGYRIGFGGGYYDRFLAGYTGKTIALAFDEQVVSLVPTDPYDLPVERIITDKNTYITKMNGGNIDGNELDA
ncbi:MAG: 5-formyltetrahydrofolate cyclo-ligase [Solibacillus sp.]